MWTLVVLCYLATTTYGQNSRRPESYDNGHGWDIRLAVPGQPGSDYPTLSSIPRTSFSCSGKSPGYYADVEAGCQVFRVCTLGSTYGFQSFLCPNGTLFNQEFLVCDWWMSVQCKRSQQLFNDNREKFGNLKLGPQLMKDIKKMLTHPMRFPYDKSIMKSNIIMMQDYKPPTGQLFPIGALISGPERSPSNVYIPSKQRQVNFAQNSFVSGDLSFAASTPSSQYIPSSNTIGTPDFNNIEILQPQQNQNLRLLQNGRTESTPNSHTGQLTHTKNTEFINNNKRIQSQAQNLQNVQHSQPTSKSTLNNQLQRQISQYNNNMRHSSNNKKIPEFEIYSRNHQYAYIPKQNLQDIQKNNFPQFSRTENVHIGREAKQSSNIPPIGKTLKFSRIVQKSSTGNPKSRITFKTWIVRPPKSARLVAEPTPYTYDKPENLVTDNSTTESINPETEDVPYVYNKPSNRQIATTVANTPPLYLPPTAPTSYNRIYSTSRTPQLSRQSNLYLAPTTYKPASRLYVPPTENNLELSRLYLSPNPPLSETQNYQSARLVATPTTPASDSTTVISNNKQNPSFTLTKQSHINTNHNNLTFADILTKEKLDITVNDIVKDTNKILNSASPAELNQYQYSKGAESDHLTNEFESEKLTEQPAPVHKSEKIIATPSSDLEPPPLDTTNFNSQNSNRLLSLPYFQQPAVPTNTIERTVSLKITIPETIAEYLFKNHTESPSDNLEILNTGSSNYLVLTNNRLNENSGAGLVPIGKLIWDKNVNISNSQALVYSFLADSINAAKEYNNIARQNVVSPTPIYSQIQNLNNEDLGEITDKISQLTALQYGKTSTAAKYKDSSKYTTDQPQRQSIHNHQENTQFSRKILDKTDQLYAPHSQRLTNNNHVTNIQKNSNQIYSGQLYKLPVPEVTSQIYNLPSLTHSSNARLTKELEAGYPRREKNEEFNSKNSNKETNKDVEFIPTESLSYPSARQELPRTEESTFNKEDNENEYVDNYLNADTGITAQVQDKIIGTLPHPLEENKLVTYQKNKSYYLYTNLDDKTYDNSQTTQRENVRSNQESAKFIRNNDFSNDVTFELFPSIGYELEDETEKQQLLNALKINDFKSKGFSENVNKRQNRLISGIDYTILHPSSRNQAERLNNINTILYRGPSSYLAPQSSVGSLGNQIVGGNQQVKSNFNSRIEQLDDNNNNGYSKDTPARKFSF